MFYTGSIYQDQTLLLTANDGSVQQELLNVMRAEYGGSTVDELKALHCTDMFGIGILNEKYFFFSFLFGWGQERDFLVPLTPGIPPLQRFSLSLKGGLTYFSFSPPF